LTERYAILRTSLIAHEMAPNTSLAKLTATERASMRFQVEARRRSHDGDEQIRVAEAVFTFVAINSGSRLRPLPSG
jgi:acyl-CoA hydrolase